MVLLISWWLLSLSRCRIFKCMSNSRTTVDAVYPIKYAHCFHVHWFVLVMLAVEVWERIRDLIPRFTGHVMIYRCWDVNPCEQKRSHFAVNLLDLFIHTLQHDFTGIGAQPKQNRTKREPCEYLIRFDICNSLAKLLSACRDMEKLSALLLPTLGEGIQRLLRSQWGSFDILFSMTFVILIHL